MKFRRSKSRRASRETDLERELQTHLELEAEERSEAGLPPEEARFAARRALGNTTQIKEDVRMAWGFQWLDGLLRDVRYTLRRLRKSPAFTITVILTLALGIGATTSIFTLVHAILLKSLPVAEPGELYRVGKEARCCYWGGYSQKDEFSIFSYDLYKYLRDNTHAFAELAAFQAGESLLGVRRAGKAEAAHGYPGEFVSGNYFTMFGIGAYAGRLLTARDDQANAPPVAVMSYRLWQQRYGSDPSVIGATFTLDGKPFTVVGITPPGFFGDKLSALPPDFFLPLATAPWVGAAGDIHQPDQYWLDLIGRVRPGANPASIEAGMRVELKQWLRSHWGDMSANDRALFPEQTLFLRPGGAGITGMREKYQHWLEILMVVTVFVLLIVCANVANLMLVRGLERRREISLSMALGARVSRLVRQALTESIVLSLAGGAAGLAIAFAGTDIILHLVFPRIAGLAGVPISASPSLPVMLFAFAVSLIAGIVFGVAPAWAAARVDPIEALRGAGRSAARKGSLPRKTLVVFQAALSLALLAASGLLTAALRNIEHQKFGFDQNRRTIVRMDASLVGYQPDQLTALYGRIRNSLSGIPGVSDAAICQYAPLSGNSWGAGVWVDGRPAPGPHDDNSAGWDRVTAGYFSAIGTPIIRGRGISEDDTANSRHVAVINEAFARKFFKHENPIGKYFAQIGMGTSRQYEIVGIAQDARYFDSGLDKPVGPMFFLPEAQHDFLPGPKPADADQGSHFLHDIVIVTRPGASVSEARIRQAMASVDPNLPIISIETLGVQVAAQFMQQRLIAQLTSFFGILSLLLASIGLYGVTAYNAGQRTHEMGVRLALGATPPQVASLIVRGALALVGIGLVIGLPLALAGGIFLGSQLYGLNPYDPAVIFLSVLALGFSALVASSIPALRASLISPAESLRAE